MTNMIDLIIKIFCRIEMKMNELVPKRKHMMFYLLQECIHFAVELTSLIEKRMLFFSMILDHTSIDIIIINIQ